MALVVGCHMISTILLLISPKGFAPQGWAGLKPRCELRKSTPPHN